MADLPLVNPEVIGRIISTPSDIAFGPGRGGGTNAIFIKDCSLFHVDYYGASFLKHKKIAEESGLSCDIVDSFRLHTDVDEEEDLVDSSSMAQGVQEIFSGHAGSNFRSRKEESELLKNKESNIHLLKAGRFMAIKILLMVKAK